MGRYIDARSSGRWSPRLALDLALTGIPTGSRTMDIRQTKEIQAPYNPPSQSVTRTPDSLTPALLPHSRSSLTYSDPHSHSHPHLRPIKLPPFFFPPLDPSSGTARSQPSSARPLGLGPS
eukprot:scaffold13197_cov95-Isochrysis_galbana.AAC.3